jgi:CTP:molybdopterin cytidylyltransferase MocA
VTGHPAAVILAAGRGERVGQPKHRLPAAGGTFLEKVLNLAREAGCDPVICVVAAEEADLVRGLNEAMVRVVVNPDPARGMLSSLREALDHVTDVPGVFVFPVDHPYIAPATARLLRECVHGQLDAVVKPEYLGRGGHPVYVPATLFGRIAGAGMDESLRTIIADSGIRSVRILVNDEGVVHNVNTPDDVK